MYSFAKAVIIKSLLHILAAILFCCCIALSSYVLTGFCLVTPFFLNLFICPTTFPITFISAAVLLSVVTKVTKSLGILCLFRKQAICGKYIEIKGHTLFC